MATQLYEIKLTASNMIIEAVNFASIAGLNATDCGVNLSASLYLNVRDAMFHFKALCDCNEEDNDNILKHYFNLKEHLLRGEKDAIIFQVQAVCDAVYDIMQQKGFDEIFHIEEVKRLQKLMHNLKNVVLKLRIEGAKLPNESEFSVFDAWNEVTNYTMQVVQICRGRNISLF